MAGDVMSFCLFGASFPSHLSHVARYAPSVRREICIQIEPKIHITNFIHLLKNTIGDCLQIHIRYMIPI